MNTRNVLGEGLTPRHTRMVVDTANIDEESTSMWQVEKALAQLGTAVRQTVEPFALVFDAEAEAMPGLTDAAGGVVIQPRLEVEDERMMLREIAVYTRIDVEVTHVNQVCAMALRAA